MNWSAWAVVLVQLVVMVGFSPILIGLMRQVRAKLEGRVGQGIGQPWRDVRKLLAKETLRADGTTWVSIAGPVVLVATSLVVCALIPLVGTSSLRLVPDDLFVVVGVLLLGTVAMAMIGLDAGSAFGGMGSSRTMMIAALVEPTVLLAVYALSTPVGSSSLSLIVSDRLSDPKTIVAPASLLALVALSIAVIAETGRLPVDNPSTHLELTMVHEAMILESSGRDLAWVELGSWLRVGALLGLVATLILPWGIAVNAGLGALVVGSVALMLKLSLVGIVLAAGEVFLAKLRLFRVPELLSGSFLLAFLAVTASFLMVTG